MIGPTVFKLILAADKQTDYSIFPMEQGQLQKGACFISSGHLTKTVITKCAQVCLDSEWNGWQLFNKAAWPTFQNTASGCFCLTTSGFLLGLLTGLLGYTVDKCVFRSFTVQFRRTPSMVWSWKAWLGVFMIRVMVVSPESSVSIFFSGVLPGASYWRQLWKQIDSRVGTFRADGRIYQTRQSRSATFSRKERLFPNTLWPLLIGCLPLVVWRGKRTHIDVYAWKFRWRNDRPV